MVCIWPKSEEKQVRMEEPYKYVTLNFPKNAIDVFSMFHVKRVITFALFPEILFSHTNEE